MEKIPNKPSGCLLPLAIALILIGLPIVFSALFGVFYTIDEYATNTEREKIESKLDEAKADSLQVLQDSVIAAMTAERQPQLDAALERGDTLLYDSLDSELNADISYTLDSLDLYMPTTYRVDAVTQMIIGVAIIIFFAILGLTPLILGIIFLLIFLTKEKKYKEYINNSDHLYSQ